MRNWIVGLIAVAALVWADASLACDRPSGGGSAVYAQRSFPAYQMPRMSVANFVRPQYPPPIYPRPYPNPYAFPNPYMPVNSWTNPFPYQQQPGYGQDAGGGYATTPVTNFASLSQPAAPAAPKQPTRIIAPSLPVQQEPVALPAGTNRMRYVALTVTGMTGTDAADRIEQEVGKLAGVRGVNVKRGNGPATVKVWYNDKEPVAEKDVLAEVEKLGFKATLVEGS